MILTGICLSIGGVFGKHALDTISFPGSFRSEIVLEAKHGWLQSYYVDFNVDFNVEASREPLFNL